MRSEWLRWRSLVNGHDLYVYSYNGQCITRLSCGCKACGMLGRRCLAETVRQLTRCKEGPAASDDSSDEDEGTHMNNTSRWQYMHWRQRQLACARLESKRVNNVPFAELSGSLFPSRYIFISEYSTVASEPL
jgi:hypothetical protein